MPYRSTEIDHGWVEVLLLDSSPEFQLISVAVTFVAVVTLAAQVDGERASAWRGRAVNGTRAVKLIPAAGHGVEAELRQDALHRDLVPQSVEVDAGHREPFREAGCCDTSRTVPFPLNL